MQTNQNLGQIGVMAVSSAVLNISLALGAVELAGYGAAFGLLLAPTLLLVLLSGRTRGA